MSYPGQPDPYRQPYQQPPPEPTWQQPGYGPPTPPPPNRPPGRPNPPPSKGVPVPAVIAIAAGALLFGAILGLGLGGISQEEPDSLAAATDSPAAAEAPVDRDRETADEDPEPSPEPSQSPEPTTVTIPDDLVGSNAAVAEDRLRELGITRVEFGSVDAADTVVIVAANWSVVAVEPEPGTEVSTDSLVVLSVTKQ